MIRYLLKLLRTQTSKLVTYSLINSGCFFMLVLAVLLVPNSSQAFQKDDAVVAQNKGPGKHVIVRSSSGISDPWEATVTGSVPNGARGVIQQGPERRNNLLWYKVEWQTLGANLVGWSAETVTVDGCKVIGPAAKADRRDAITEALFRIIPHTDTNHDYNGYGCFPSKQDGYIGGHSGWDVQTITVGGIETADEPFYSLTPGIVIKVIKAEKGNLNKTSVIAIYNEACDKTTLYLHAREIDPSIINSVDKYIDKRKYLGIQGGTGLWHLATARQREEYKGKEESFREHVHIEVIEGDLREKEEQRPARGAYQSIDPIPYLYRWVNGDLKAGFLPWDINHDGDVDIFDFFKVLMSILGSFRGEYDSRCDVNSDGTVNTADLAEVKEHFGDPPPGSPNISIRNRIDGITKHADQFFIGGTVVSPEMVQQLLDITRKEDNGSIHFKQGIAILESLLAEMLSEVMIPEKTVLFANYPNPFNPETWIPYHLAKDTEVTVKIYDATGALVRRLEMGYQKAGYYTNPKRAVYWDGKNELGERVASGVYFYTLKAGDCTATRKMIVRK